MSKGWTAGLAALAGMAVAGVVGGVGPIGGDGEATAVPAAPAGDTSEVRTITGTGTGRVRSTPDTMTVDIGVETRGATAQDALGQNREKSTAVFEALRSSGVAEEDVQTSSLYASPVFDDDGERITGYEVSNSVTATLRDIDKAGEVIDAAAGVAGGDVRVSSVYFSIEDASDFVTAARAEAVKRASAQAQQLAAAAGLELGDVLSIEETTTPVGPPVDFESGGVAEDQAAPSTPINPGTQELTVDVVVRFAIG